MTWAERAAETGIWLQGVRWPDGTSSGIWQTEDIARQLLGSYSVRGKTARDVGCMAGVATMFLEKWGAEVNCCDPDPRWQAQFALVKEAFGIAAEFTVAGVHELARFTPVDVVWLTGIYYHLQSPVSGLQNAWAHCREVLFIEGEVIDTPPDDQPWSLFVPGEYKGDCTNWTIPTVACLRGWLTTLQGASEVEVIHPFRGFPHRAAARVWR